MVENFVEIPNDYLCPITGEIMEDPVVAEDGQTYERVSITTWFRRKKTSPVTGANLRSTVLFENHRLKALIKTFKESMPAIQREVQIKRDLQEAINAREAYFEDRLKKEEEKFSNISRNYNTEREKINVLEKELGDLKKYNVMLQQNLFEVGNTIKAKDEEIKRLKDENKIKSQKILETNITIEAKDEEIKRIKDQLEKTRVSLEKNMLRVEIQKNEEIKKLKEELVNAKSALENQKNEENKWQWQSIPAMDNRIKFQLPKIDNKERGISQLIAQESSHRFIQPDIGTVIWICSKCFHENQTSWDLCSMCFTKKPGINGWVCEKCSLINSPNKTSCDVCGSRKEIERSINSFRESERSTVLNYEKNGYAGGFYAITPKWIGDWINYTKGGQSPGRLITSNFFDSDGMLKQGLRNFRDYRMINKCQWEYLYSIYGGDSPLVCSSFDIYSLISGRALSSISRARNTGDKRNFKNF